MSEKYAISRIAKYKFSDIGGVLKEALRILPNYDNPDCDPTRSHLNVALVECDLQGLTPEKYILKYRKENNIKGRFNTVAKNPKNLTNCAIQVLFTASSDFFDGLSHDDTILFFQNCLEFYKEQFSSSTVLSAIIHFDETTPHMHVTALPTFERVNPKSGEKEVVFSTTDLMPGKEFMPQYQDRFYNFISSKYDGVFTKGNSDRKNLSVKDYKEYMDLMDKYKETCRSLKACEKTIDNQRQKIASLYDDLKTAKKQTSILEAIPLLGLLISLIKELKVEIQRDIISAAIDQAKAEKRREEADLRDSLDYQVLSAEKRRLIDKLFGTKTDKNRDGFYR